MAALPSWLIVYLIEILKAAPLASATAWFVLAILQVYRDRWHTWTEAFFLFCCFFAGLYAIGDFLLFYSTTYGAALFSTLVSLTGLTLAVNFFLLFTLVYVDRMRRSYGLLMTISIVMLLILWGRGITDITPLTFEGQTLYVAFFDPLVLGLYLIYVVTFSVLGIWNLFRLYKIVRASSKTLARRGAGLDVIQNFMRTSFPILRGKSLSSIVHGTYTLVIEKARYCYLTVVLEGEETDQLRRQMRDVLITFEAQNRPALQKWQGVPSEARGTEQLLTGFFVESPLV